MSSTSHRPSSGVRFVVERQEDPSATTSVLYCGFAHLPEADFPLSVEIALPGGSTRASIPGGPPELEKTAAALVRAATKAAVSGGAALPRKIVRWRG